MSGRLILCQTVHARQERSTVRSSHAGSRGRADSNGARDGSAGKRPTPTAAVPKVTLPRPTTPHVTSAARDRHALAQDPRACATCQARRQRWCGPAQQAPAVAVDLTREHDGLGLRRRYAACALRKRTAHSVIALRATFNEYFVSHGRSLRLHVRQTQQVVGFATIGHSLHVLDAAVAMDMDPGASELRVAVRAPDGLISVRLDVRDHLLARAAAVLTGKGRPEERDNLTMICNIVAVGRRRDGGTRYWCLEHHANATAKYGTPAEKCVAADDPPIAPEDTLDLDFKQFPGGVALWGSVPAVYDTTPQPMDRGIHVHARRKRDGDKAIDRTYRKLRIPVAKDLLSDGWAEVDEIDAINYMVSSVFGFETIGVNCNYCGFAHLDRDWFSVHVHKRHQCHGCGRQFSDTAPGVGNPLATIRHLLKARPSNQITAPRTKTIKQRDYPGGIQIWGSNPAIVWTANSPEETGIHLHGFTSLDQTMPELDDTFAQVSIDGARLDATHVRVYMAQSAMPHLEGRVVALACPSCDLEHFDQGDMSFTPHIDHECHSCGTVFQSPTQMKKTIGNPFVATRKKLALKAPNLLRNDKLGLRVESI